eukprot:5976908-Prymnesium_polylepis.1
MYTKTEPSKDDKCDAVGRLVRGATGTVAVAADTGASELLLSVSGTGAGRSSGIADPCSGFGKALPPPPPKDGSPPVAPRPTRALLQLVDSAGVRRDPFEAEVGDEIRPATAERAAVHVLRLVGGLPDAAAVGTTVAWASMPQLELVTLGLHGRALQVELERHVASVE